MKSVTIYPEADGRIKFIIEEEFFNEYGLTGDYFVSGNPIPEAVFDALFDMAEAQYDSVKFNRDSFGSSFDKTQDKVELVVRPIIESKIIDYLDYNEEFYYIELYRSFLELDDNKIFLGWMTWDKKRKELEKLRNDREYLRQYLKENGII